MQRCGVGAIRTSDRRFSFFNLAGQPGRARFAFTGLTVSCSLSQSGVHSMISFRRNGSLLTSRVKSQNLLPKALPCKRRMPWTQWTMSIVFLSIGACETLRIGLPTNGNTADDASTQFTWRSVANGLTGPVNSFVTYRGKLLAAGGPNFLSWLDDSSNPPAWKVQAGGTTGPINDMGVLGADLFVGGVFTQAGVVAAENIARFDGVDWHAMGDGLDAAVLTIGQFNGELIAGGLFNASGQAPLSRIARWDGQAWHAMGDGFDGPVFALAEYKGELIAGGDFGHSGSETTRRLARWDGTAWSEFAGGADGAVYDLAVIGDVLVAGGAFTEIGATPANRVARWNNSQWTAYGDGVAGCAGDPCTPAVLIVRTFDGKLTIGGNFVTAEGSAVNGLAIWDRGVWSPLGAGLAEVGYLDVRALLADDSLLIVGGRFASGGRQAGGSIKLDNVATVTAPTAIE